MAFKSEAQRRKFASLVETGKMSKTVFDEWDKNTKGPLPKKLGQTKSKPVSSVDNIRETYRKRFGK